MRRFRPSEYGEKSTSESESSETSLHKNVNRIVKKGGNPIKMDLSEIDALVRRLRQNCNLPVKGLPHSVGKDFRRLLTYVSLLHGTKQYAILHGIVSNHFRNISDIIPGTIGAYCAGCSVKTSFDNDLEGCSAVCAGSMPPKDDDWNFCKNMVLLATYREGKFYFTISKRSETKDGRETAFVFVNYTDGSDFPGFSDDEKLQLKKLGILNVYLNGYGDDGLKYSGMGNRILAVDEIKSRQCDEDSYKNNQNDFSESSVIAILLVVIILLLFFAWRSTHHT